MILCLCTLVLGDAKNPNRGDLTGLSGMMPLMFFFNNSCNSNALLYVGPSLFVISFYIPISDNPNQST